MNRLLYSAEVHALQKELGELNQQLTEAKTAEEAEEIYTESVQLLEQLQADPIYAQVNDSFTQMLMAEIEAEVAGAGERPTEHAPSAHRLYLPMITSSTNTEEITTTQAAATEQINAAPDYTRLTRGDIMFIRGSSNLAPMLYSVIFGHTGNYDGGDLVYEANDDGVRLKPISGWQDATSAFVGFGYNNDVSSSQVSTALDQAKTQYGTDGRTPYNWNFVDRYTEDRLYCSQLTWRIHRRLGYNLDSNDWIIRSILRTRYGAWFDLVVLPAILPDEIWKSPYVTLYLAGSQ